MTPVTFVAGVILRSVLEGYRRYRCALLVVRDREFCVHYGEADRSDRTARHHREAPDDARMRDFGRSRRWMPQPPRWSLRSLTLLAFYYHPALDEARAAADGPRGAIVTAGAVESDGAADDRGDTTTSPAWMPGSTGDADRDGR